MTLPFTITPEEARAAVRVEADRKSELDNTITAVYTHCPEMLARAGRQPSDALLLLAPESNTLWRMHQCYSPILLNQVFPPPHWFLSDTYS